MWGSRFFNSRHFTSRFWSATGASSSAVYQRRLLVLSTREGGYPIVTRVQVN